MRTGIIYLITNKVDGKQYVGKSIETLVKRWYRHKSAAKNGKGFYLHRAMRNHGTENFTAEVIVEYDPVWLNHFETWHINKLDTLAPSGYNLTTGGDGLQNPTDETRLKIRESKKGKPNGRSGVTLSHQTKSLISASLTGITRSAETQERNRSVQLGTKHSPDRKGRQRVAQRLSRERERAEKETL
jgi:group I intron endonuclease